MNYTNRNPEKKYLSGSAYFSLQDNGKGYLWFTMVVKDIKN